MALLGTTGAADVKSTSAPVYVGAAVQSLKLAAPKVEDPVRWKDESGSEGITTDVGSDSNSDTDSSLSASSVMSVRRRPISLGDVGLFRLRRKATVRQRNNFGGTVLETIPGTPAAAEKNDSECFLQQRCDTSPWPLGNIHERTCPDTPVSATRRLRDATINNARRAGIPLKVRLPVHVVLKVPPTMAELSLPVKKRLPFVEIAGPEAAEALRRVDQSKPVKKCPAIFLLDDTPRAFLSPHGSCMEAPDLTLQQHLTIGPIRCGMVSAPPGLEAFGPILSAR